MKIKISRDIRKYIILYLALLLILYLVIEIVPRVTTVFESTQILEPGNLMLTCEATGYLIKSESIAISPESGKIQYLVKEGTAVRKNQKVINIFADEADTKGTPRYEDLLEGMKGYPGIVQTMKTPASGIFSLTMDGSEQALNPAHMDKLTYDKVKDLPLDGKDLEQSSVSAGDPIYKITNDNRWYVACWLEEADAENYSEGQNVRLEMPAGTVEASVQSVSKEEKKYRIIFSSDAYYSDLAQTRKADFTIQSGEQTGLIVDNDCIIEKDGVTGVYVRNKNGDYSFTRINVIETDGKDSVISETSFYVPKTDETVYTVNVYDEVLKHPQKELKKEQREQEKEKENHKTDQ